MSYILLILYLALFLFIIYRVKFYQTSLFPKYIVAAIFLLKFIGGIMVYMVYTHFYDHRFSSDIFKYFDDGNIIYSSLHENPMDYLRMVTGIGGGAEHLIKYYNTCCFWIKDFNYGLFNDNRTVIRFNAIVRLFSMGNIHIHTLVISFLSFTGLWAIFKIFEETFAKQKWLLVSVIFFFPSVYFWTSGLLKEGILMFAFGLFLYQFKSYFNEPKIKHILSGIFFLLLLLISKFYVLVAAVPGILFLIVIQLTGEKYFLYKLISVLLFFFIISWFSEALIHLNFPVILARKQNDFINYTNSQSYVGSKIAIPILEPTMKSILINSPGAFFRTLFRPTIFESSNLMSLLAAVENLILCAGLIFTVTFLNKKKIKSKWFGFSILFVIVLFTLSGLTTPVLGALVRYKAPALPFLGLILMYLIDFEKVSKLRKRLIPF